MYKEEVDRRVAILTGIPVQEVEVVTDCFFKQLFKELARERAVRVPFLGVFKRTSYQEVVLRLTTPTAIKLGEEVRNMKEDDAQMEKYGVDERANIPDAKTASTTNCPRCGADVDAHGNIKKCPNCGTEPFE